MLVVSKRATCQNTDNPTIFIYKMYPNSRRRHTKTAGYVAVLAWRFGYVAVLVVAVLEVSPFWRVAVLVFAVLDVSPFWLSPFWMCRRFGCRRFGFVAILTGTQAGETGLSVSCEPLRTKIDTYSSFCVRLPPRDQHLLLVSRVWLSGVMVRAFLE